MKTFTVKAVIDGDTFSVVNGWKWGNFKGSDIRPTGYDTPEKGQPGYQLATEQLRKLIEGKQVELKNPVNVSYGRLVCDVYYKGKNLADYFLKYS